ncbi:peptide chain release factor 1 [bacterium]|nr:peptide chain release factor 1 [bacterium]
MLDKLQKLEKRYTELTQLLADPGIMKNQDEYRKLTREYSWLEEIVKLTKDYRKTLADIEEDKQIMKSSNDEDLVELARSEIAELEDVRDELEAKIKIALIPPDPNEGKNVICEIRAGTGGEEASLFAGDLFRMYSLYAESERWKIEVMSSNPSDLGGFKEIVFQIRGENVYKKMKFESGVHRVQRVPETESSGRLHTSAVSVAILPEVEDVEVDLSPDDLKIDTFRSSGPGGQHVNKTDSAIRITHIPTGIVVSCQDEKSQHKNKAKAMKILRTRLWAKEQEEQQAKRAKQRRLQVGTGDRSEKIRTYNYPQNRVTDHRINLTLYKLDQVMNGDLEEIFEELQQADMLDSLEELYSEN